MYNEVNLDSVRSLLESKTSTLKSGTVDKTDFYAGWGDPPEIQDIFPQAVDYKRRGDLITSNQYLCEAFRRMETFHSPFVWSWCKIMILAKNWECLRDLLKFHFDMMVVWNRLMRDENNEDFFNNYAAFNMIPYFEFNDFHAGEHLRDQVHSPLIERDEATARLSEYGGSPYWQSNYYITDSEWREFLNIFPVPEL